MAEIPTPAELFSLPPPKISGKLDPSVKKNSALSRKMRLISPDSHENIAAEIGKVSLRRWVYGGK
jgi:hypothetical protein